MTYIHKFSFISTSATTVPEVQRYRPQFIDTLSIFLSFLILLFGGICLAFNQGLSPFLQRSKDVCHVYIYLHDCTCGIYKILGQGAAAVAYATATATLDLSCIIINLCHSL